MWWWEFCSNSWIVWGMNYCSVWLIVAWFWWGKFEDYWMLLTVPKKKSLFFSFKSHCAIEPISSHLWYSEEPPAPEHSQKQRWQTYSGPSDPPRIRYHLPILISLVAHLSSAPEDTFKRLSPTLWPPATLPLTHTHPFTSSAKGTKKRKDL